jgi:hypothetical protein
MYPEYWLVPVRIELGTPVALRCGVKVLDFNILDRPSTDIIVLLSRAAEILPADQNFRCLSLALPLGDL